MAKKQGRVETGVLERHAPFLFLRNRSGHHWRPEVEEERVAHLLGSEVRVVGKSAAGSIKVESIIKA